jgi:MSHA biogenesis protein MshL
MSTHPTRRLQPLAISLACCLALGGCETMSAALGGETRSQPVAEPLMPAIRQALSERPGGRPGDKPAGTAAGPGTAARPAPDTAGEVTALPAVRQERRFSVVLNGASPEALFMALLAETPLSVAVDPSVKGPISIALRDVTLREALELLRELHNLEYKVIGRHILVGPAQLQTRIFAVDYPSFNRQGRSDLRVVSGSITGGSGSSGAPGNVGGGGAASSGGSSPESSRISTQMRNDLWAEIESTVKLLVGDKEGRSVVVSPQTGNVVVRALPRELRTVADYLETTRASVQRQVMLEAKVVEVTLRDSERSGINWSAFRLGNQSGVSLGVAAPGSQLGRAGELISGLLTSQPGSTLEAAATAPGSLLGLAFRTSNFAAVLDFLGTQGSTQVLSSPRIATMNNQKAVLKVGTDDFFVTNVSTTTTPVGNTTSSSPNITVQPFFSGISLDVTPHIDSNGFITLHVHPAVSTVSERNKVLNLGTQGSFTLPLASSDVNETDAVVRARDGQIIAIGGLMRQTAQTAESGLPGLVSQPLRKIMGGQTSRLTEKRELVILLKPTIIDPQRGDDDLRADALDRLLEWTEVQRAARTPALPAAAPAAKPSSAAPAGTPVAAAPPPAPAAAGAPTASAEVPKAGTVAPTAPATESAAPAAPVAAQAGLAAAAQAAVAAAAAPSPAPQDPTRPTPARALASAAALATTVPLPPDTSEPIGPLNLPELVVLEPAPARPAERGTDPRNEKPGRSTGKAKAATDAAARGDSPITDAAPAAAPAASRTPAAPAADGTPARRDGRQAARQLDRGAEAAADPELARQRARAQTAATSPRNEPAPTAKAAPSRPAAEAHVAQR